MTFAGACRRSEVGNLVGAGARKPVSSAESMGRLRGGI
jgi:hypothetical protein